MLSVESGNTDVLFNIYGGDFTNNKLYKAPLMSIYSFNIYGGNFSVGKLSNDTGSSNLISINGGIIDTLDIKGSNTLTLSGGSIGILEAESSTTTLVSAKLPEAAKVEYIEYSIDGGTNPNSVNINSPFNITESGVVYSYDDKFDSSEENVFNNSEYNPAIKEFNVFLPSSEVDLISSIKVHLAEGEPVELTKVEGCNPVKFGEQ